MKTPDIAALLIICICGLLMLLGIDSEVKSVFLIAAGWAFGRGKHAITRKEVLHDQEN